jgi:hypothetical protein
MAPRAETGRGPAGRLALAAAGVLALLAVVALASRGGLGGGSGHPQPRHALLDRLFTGFLVVFLLYIPVAAWIYWNQRKHAVADALPRRRSTVQSLVTFAAILVAVLLLVRLRDRLHLTGGGGQTITAGTFPTATTAPVTTADRYEPRFDWGSALVVLGLAAVLLGGFLAFRKREEDEEPPDLAAQVSSALDDSLDDLLAERDPRRAVIAAYARMERALGAAGVPRVAHEAPFEYVGRALRNLEVGERAVRRLTDLFERARFSTHAIDEGMRTEAIAALTEVRDELRGAGEAAA